jgi:hypothetical protein
MDIFLVSDDETAQAYKMYDEFKECAFYKVSDGPGKLEGQRIHNAYIDRYCYEDPNYIACVEVIHGSIRLTSKDGKIILI